MKCTAAEPEGVVKPARLIADNKKGEIPEPVEFAQRVRGLKTDDEDNRVQLVQQGLVLTQLRDMLSAGDSPQPSQEHEQHGLSNVRLQGNDVPLHIHSIVFKDIVHD